MTAEAAVGKFSWSRVKRRARREPRKRRRSGPTWVGENHRGGTGTAWYDGTWFYPLV